MDRKVDGDRCIDVQICRYRCSECPGVLPGARHRDSPNRSEQIINPRRECPQGSRDSLRCWHSSLHGLARANRGLARRVGPTWLPPCLECRPAQPSHRRLGRAPELPSPRAWVDKQMEAQRDKQMDAQRDKQMEAQRDKQMDAQRDKQMDA